MSEFWWGVLALPIIVTALAAAASAVMGAWTLYEKWAIQRWTRLQEVQVPEKIGAEGRFQTWTAARTGNRGGYLSLLLAGGKGFCFRLTPGTAVLFLSAGKADTKKARIIREALERMLSESAKAEGRSA